MKNDIYISRNVLNYADIVEWARKSGFETMMPEDSLHITVVYCREEVDWSLVSRDEPEMLLVSCDKKHPRAVHKFDGGACVLEVKSDDLDNRSNELRQLGIHSKFPDYRAHITITYNKPNDLNVDEIEPYRGPIILGPEKIARAVSDWKEETKEITFRKSSLTEESLYDFDANRLYDVFKKSYDDATGTSWSQDKFLSRARNWTFYGDEEGFVAFREQASGMRKLVGVAGDTKGIVVGLKRLMDEGKPVWGAVSDRLALAGKRFGLIAPHRYIGGPTVIKIIMNSIPDSVFGGIKPKIDSDGGVTLNMDEVGEVKKFFVANKAYFAQMIKVPSFKEHIQNSIALKFINMILK